MKKGPADQDRTPKPYLGGFYTMNSESIWVLYDLSDALQWEQAGRDRRAWGHEMTEIHTVTNDLIVVEFLPGGALETSA